MVPLAIDAFVGGRFGPVLVRHSPPEVLRLLIAALGLVLAATLGWQAHH